MALLKVKTSSGWVEGLPAGNQAVSMFRGIPYAKPPVGELRWRAPEPVEPWEGVRKAYAFGNICYQERRASEGGDDVIGNEFYCIEYPMSEDCLYLNIWTPAKNENEKLPVAVYLHGGGYCQGYGHLNCYDGEGFAKRGCVFVTLNHRLGVFGYLAHPELTAEDPHHTSGNNGALDIIFALRWVEANIAAFGGDPDRISIFGQSGGGGKVSQMITSPLINDLIKGAIMQSGGGMDKMDCYPSLQENEKEGVALFSTMGVKNVEEARRLTSEELLQGVRNHFHNDFWAMMDFFKPSVDGYVFPKSSLELYRNGAYPDIPYMIGCTSGEFVDRDAEVPPLAQARKEAAALYGEEHVNAFLKAVRYGEDPEYTKRMYQYYTVMESEMQAADISWCENQLALGRKPSYQYFFTLTPPGAKEAHHSAEHHYVFQTLVRSKRAYTGRDWDLSNQLADYWANFIKTGNPNGDGLTEWTPYTADSKKALEINYDLHMAENETNDLTDLIVKLNLGKN